MEAPFSEQSSHKHRPSLLTKNLPLTPQHILLLTPHHLLHPINAPRPVIPIPPLMLSHRLLTTQIHTIDAFRPKPFLLRRSNQTLQLHRHAVALEVGCAWVRRHAWTGGDVFGDARAIEGAEDDLLAKRVIAVWPIQVPGLLEVDVRVRDDADVGEVVWRGGVRKEAMGDEDVAGFCATNLGELTAVC